MLMKIIIGVAALKGKNCHFSFEEIDQKTDETIAEIMASATLPWIPA